MSIAVPRQTQQPFRDKTEMASLTVDKFLQDDKKYLDLSDLLKVPSQNKPSQSGLSDFDYPNLADINVGIESLPELSPVKRVPLPPELTEQFNRVQFRCIMGLFPQVHRAWLTIDSDIFIWRFSDGSDLAYFDGLGETIMSVALVPPQPYIFEPRIQYLLCIATSIEIVLLGVTFTQAKSGSDPYSGEMHLLPEPLFSVPTDRYIINITSSVNGRIFLSARDGCLYELTYQADSGWFSRKCRLINQSTSYLSLFVPSFVSFSFTESDPLIKIAIDNTRGILYTLSEKGSIQVYDLGQDCSGLSRVASLHHNTIEKRAAAICKTIDSSNFKPIIHIAALTRQDSLYINLVAISQAGVRLYFSTTPFKESTNQRPVSLNLVHIRLPPGYAVYMTSRKPSNIHSAYYRKGTALFASSQTEESDLLWCMSADSFPFQQQLMETQVSLPLDGRTWDICELPSLTPANVPRYNFDARTSEANSKVLERSDPPLVVTQHIEYQRTFVILNSQGTFIFNKMRPVDQLRQLFVNGAGPDSEHVKAFFRLHKIDQACATCLILACSKIHADKEISEWARVAFFMYGGEPMHNYSSINTPMVPTNIGPSTPHMPGYANVPSAGALSLAQNQSFGFTGSTTFPPNMTFDSPSGEIRSPAQHQLQQPSTSMNLVFQPTQASTPQNRNAYIPASFVQQPQMAFNQSVLGQSSMYARSTLPQTPGTVHHSGVQAPSTDVIFSGKHNGICIYLARLLKPLWEYPVVVDVPQITPKETIHHLTCSYKPDELLHILELMQDLSHFLKTNSQFDSPVLSGNISALDTMTMSQSIWTRRDGAQLNDIAKRKLQDEAQLSETQSLQSLSQLIDQACEVIGLLNILMAHQFHTLTATLTQDERNMLKAMTFKLLVIDSRQIFGGLIRSLIDRYHDDNAATDIVSQKLRETCPSLYSSEDATCSKASEILKSIKFAATPFERQQRLNDALRLYKDVVSSIHLPTICSNFASVQFYNGIVDLCVTAAQKRDPKNLAIHAYKMGDHVEDKLTSHAYLVRMECYECIRDTLNFLLTCSTSQYPPASFSSTSTDNEGSQNPSASEAQDFLEQVLQMSLQSEDELLHMVIYDWLIKNNLIDRLMEIKSTYLESFLTCQVSVSPDTPLFMNLLWKFHEKNQNFAAAARVMARLAERPTKEVCLQERVEHLSRAVLCMKSLTSAIKSAREGEFLHELEEKMEVARLQLQVFEELKNFSARDIAVQEALSRLDSDLLDITTLYEFFADKFHLHSCKLAIVHCAGLNDPALIEDLWLNIIDDAFTRATSGNIQSNMTVVQSKFVAVASLYSSAQQYFPLAFIVKHLERKSCAENFDSSWAFQCLLQTGAHLSNLHEIYDQMFRSKDPYWKTQKKPLHVLSVILALLNCFVETPTLITQYERRSFVNLCRDRITNYLVELQALSSTDSAVRDMASKFRHLLSVLTL